MCDDAEFRADSSHGLRILVTVAVSWQIGFLIVNSQNFFIQNQKTENFQARVLSQRTWLLMARYY